MSPSTKYVIINRMIWADLKEIEWPILRIDQCFYFVVYSICMAIATNLIQRRTDM